jgi:hypothetical protein
MVKLPADRQVADETRQSMIGKNNWEQTRNDYAAWWRHERTKPLFFITVSHEPDTPTRWNGWNMVQKAERIEEAIGDFTHAYSNYKYPLHGYPQLTINLGPGILAAFMGGEVTVRPETVWFSKHPPLRLDQDIVLDTQSWWYRQTREMSRLAAERGKGKFITGMTDLGGNLDVIASLRGAEQLLMDLADNPSRVDEWADQVTDAWLKTYWDFHGVITANQDGIGGWMGPWAPEAWYPIQCDFANMISPAMFERFVVPDLLKISRSLKHTIYHWEVPGQFPHLDILLGLDEIDGIQWNPGPQLEPPDSPKWYPLYRKIQDKGKLLVLGGVKLENLDKLFDNISTKGVFLMHGTNDERTLEKLAKYL